MAMYKIVVHVFKSSDGKRNKAGDRIMYPPIFIQRRILSAITDEAAAEIGRKVAGTISNFDAESMAFEDV